MWLGRRRGRLRVDEWVGRRMDDKDLVSRDQCPFPYQVLSAEILGPVGCVFAGILERWEENCGRGRKGGSRRRGVCRRVL